MNSAFFTQPFIERSGTPYPEKERERERESAGGMESSTGRLIKTVRCTRNGGKLSNSLFDGLTWLCLAAALQLSFSPFPVRKGNTVV